MSQFMTILPTTWNVTFRFNGLPLVSNQLLLYSQKNNLNSLLYRITFGLSQNPSIQVEEIDPHTGQSTILQPFQNPPILPGVDLAFDVCVSPGDLFLPAGLALNVYQPVANLHQIASWNLQYGLLVTSFRVGNTPTLQSFGRSIQPGCVGTVPLLPLLSSGNPTSCSGCGC